MSFPSDADSDLLSLVFATTPGAITVSRVRDGVYVAVNHGFCELSGYAQEEVIGRSALQLDIWYDADERRRFVEKLLREGVQRNALCRFRRKSGEVFYGHMSARLFDRNGEPHLFAVTQDIAEIMRAQEQAEISEARLRGLVEHIPHGVRELDLAGVILLENPAHARLFGYAPGELVGRRALDLLADPAQAEALDQEIFGADQTDDGPGAGSYTADMRHKDGRIIHVRVDWSVQRSPHGPPTVISVLTDLTAAVRAEAERRRTVDELTRSNAELERYAYIAAHDLREPIRTVTSYGQLLRRRLLLAGVLEGETAELFGYLETGAKRMSDVVDDLLAYSRLQTDAQPFGPVDLAAVLGAVQSSLARTIMETGADLEVEPLPVVTADEPQMLQLFQNLVTNALRYQPHRPGHVPRVRISAARRGAGWSFAVADNGIGIEPQYFERIFKLFQRLHGQRDYPGTGVGLAICRRIAERHGGTITVDSRPGEGTTFQVWLPDEPPSGAGEPASE
ncbi:MAG: PAS domain S-box protein [Caenispirillum bisanense]|nr:PAS domain S-box protein [Caenispirillum bisanense]MCA1974433.1 PAS domain S-box protein [Caenispirillum sp.]